MNVIKIERGKAYPVHLDNMEGAKADFLTTTNLTDTGNLLLIGMPGTRRWEAEAIRKGQMKAGFIKDGPLILWVFEFPGGLIFDCPFDSRVIPRDRLYLSDITRGQQRLFIEIHLVDSSTNLLEGLRGITLPPKLSADFLLAVRDQLADARDLEPILAKYYALDVRRLPKLVAMQVCGEDN